MKKLLLAACFAAKAALALLIHCDCLPPSAVWGIVGLAAIAVLVIGQDFSE
jgi:hypothetical protein